MATGTVQLPIDMGPGSGFLESPASFYSVLDRLANVLVGVHGSSGYPIGPGVGTSDVKQILTLGDIQLLPNRQQFGGLGVVQVHNWVHILRFCVESAVFPVFQRRVRVPQRPFLSPFH